MKRALIVTTVSGFVPQFEMNNVHILQEMGYEVHYASNFDNPHYGSDNNRLKGTGIICHQVDFIRSPFYMRANWKAYRQIKKVLQKTPFDLMHCHTPMGGVIGRLAAESLRWEQKKRGKQFDRGGEMRIFYTAHGFHFFRGAPLVNWMLYYPIERWLAHYTDVLITINEEDYRQAVKFCLRGTANQQGKVERVNGVGICLEDYRNLSVDRENKRRELGISSDACLFVSAGELTKRKNHQIVLEAFASMKKECEEKKVRYLICGEGPERRRLEKYISYKNLAKVVTLTGYRTDIREILSVSDCFIFPSKQEGLPVALLEAKAIGLPCICSNIRGNRELADTDEMVKKNQGKTYKEKIQKMINQESSMEIFQTDYSKYSKEAVMQQMREIYMENLKKEMECNEKDINAS